MHFLKLQYVDLEPFLIDKQIHQVQKPIFYYFVVQYVEDCLFLQLILHCHEQTKKFKIKEGKNNPLQKFKQIFKKIKKVKTRKGKIFAKVVLELIQ